MPLPKTATRGPFSSLNFDTAPSYKRLADLIEHEIVSGRIAPGDLMPTEADLAAQFGVHRSTVREGLRFLENSGLVKRVGGKRLMVSIPDSDALSWPTTRALGMHKVSFLELWEFLMELEPFSARLAAENATPEVTAEIDENLRQLEEHLADDSAVIALDTEFHRLIAKAGGNRALMLSVEPIGALLFSATQELYARVPPARHRLLQAHRAVANAISTGAADEARAWMLRHIRDFHRGYTLAGLDVNAPMGLPRPSGASSGQ